MKKRAGFLRSTCAAISLSLPLFAVAADTDATAVSKETKAKITVKSVDTATNTLVFVGPRGLTRTVAVKNPEMQNRLKQLKPGDEVEVVYSEALAVTVEPAKP